MALTCRYQKQMRRERSDTSAQQFSPLRKVIPDPDAKYFGAVLDKDGCPHWGKFIAGPTRFADRTRSQR